MAKELLGSQNSGTGFDRVSTDLTYQQLIQKIVLCAKQGYVSGSLLFDNGCRLEFVEVKDVVLMEIARQERKENDNSLEC